MKQGWHKTLSVAIMLALVAMLLPALLPEPVQAGGNVSVTSQYSPSAEAAITVSAGDNDGFDTNPATNAYTDDLNYTRDKNSGEKVNSTALGSGTDKHNFYNYGLGVIPTGSTINGITVRVDMAVTDLGDGPFTAIRLSWDGGTSWTAVNSKH